MRRLVLVSLFACAWTHAGCASEPRDAVRRASAPVVNGRLDDAANDDVVLIENVFDDGTAEACTGSLIGHKVVLTARHCVSRIDEATYQLQGDYEPARFHVWLGARPSGEPAAYGARIVHDGAASLADHDLALLVLDRRIGAKLSKVRLASSTAAGEAVSVVGYGLTELDAKLPSALHARYLRDDLAIAKVGPGTFFTPATYDLASHELSLGESICEGDSGGPVKSRASGALLAITSRGGNGSTPTTVPYSGCLGSKSINVFTRLDGAAKLIEETLRAVGELPWREGEPQPALGPELPGTDAGARDEAPTSDGCAHSSRSADPSGLAPLAGALLALAGHRLRRVRARAST